jgi:hypothetical protein
MEKINELINTAPCPPINDFSIPLNKKPLNKSSSNIGPNRTTPR